MEPLQSLFCLAIIARIVYRLTVGVGIVGFESHINAYLLSRRLMHESTLCLDCELDIVAISTMDNPDPLDLLGRKCCDLLLGVANESQMSDTTAVGDGDVLPVWREPPARCFVLNRAVIVLKPGIAFLAWLVVLAVV